MRRIPGHEYQLKRERGFPAARPVELIVVGSLAMFLVLLILLHKPVFPLHSNFLSRGFSKIQDLLPLV